MTAEDSDAHPTPGFSSLNSSRDSVRWVLAEDFQTPEAAKSLQRAEFALTGGDSPTTLTCVGKSCTCLQTLLNGAAVDHGSSIVIPRGETSILLLEQRLRPHVIGTDDASVTFNIEGDPARPLTYRIVTNVYKSMDIVPSRLVIKGNPDEVAGDVMDVRIASREKQSVPPTVKIVGGAPIDVRLESDGLIETLGDALYRSRFRANVTVGPLPDRRNSTDAVGAIMFQTESGSSLRVPVFVAPSSGLDGPSLVHFGSITNGIMRKRRILLRSLDDVPFQIVAVRCASNSVMARYGREAASKHWVEVQFDPSIDCVGNTSEVVFETSHPLDPEFRLEVKFNRSGGSPASI